MYFADTKYTIVESSQQGINLCTIALEDYVIMSIKPARQATLDFGDKESPAESSNVVWCCQLTSLKNIGSFHAITRGH